MGETTSTPHQSHEYLAHDPAGFELTSDSPYSKEDLRQGVTLGNREVASLNLEPNPNFPRVSLDLGNGSSLDDVELLAELQLGGEETFATGHVGEYEGERVLVISSPGTERKIALHLVPGFMFDIGRGLEGQDMLPDTISRKHCTVGVHDNGEFVVANNRPTNSTTIRTFA